METKLSPAGTMYTGHLGGKITYVIETKAGHFRGGHAYSVVKYCVLISGKCELIMSRDGVNDIVQELPLNQIVEIPANIPNIFKFLVDGVLLEYFDEGANKKEFERYTRMKK